MSYEVEERYAPFVEQIRKAGFDYAGSGSFRRAYIRKNVIIKVPQNEDGIMDNLAEAKAYSVYRNGPTTTGIYLAPCRLLSNECLMMVRVDKYPSSFPSDWCKMVDACQIGMYRGRHVAYDYALDIPERFLWEKEWNRFSDFFHSDTWLNQKPHIREAVRRLKASNRLT